MYKSAGNSPTLVLGRCWDCDKVINAGWQSQRGSLKDRDRYHIAYRIERLDTAVLAYRPGWVTIDFGINDSWQDAGKKMETNMMIKKITKSWNGFRILNFVSKVVELLLIVTAFSFGQGPLDETAINHGIGPSAFPLNGHHPTPKTYFHGYRLEKKGVKSDSLKPECFFGMRLRKFPPKISEVFEPVVIRKSPADGATILRMANGTLKIFYINSLGQYDNMMSISSTDNGISWGKPEKEFGLSGIAYHSNIFVPGQNGTLHCVFYILGKGKNGYHGQQLNLWYCHTTDQGKNWSEPRKIFDGYVGAIRGFIELKSKRLLLAFAKAVPSREKKPADTLSTDYGWNDIISMYSDDKGRTWHKSANSIKIAVDSKMRTRYGAIEPTIIELTNGKVWMLIRTNKGHLYQSFSDDGGRSWQPPEPTKFVSSDSPASLTWLSGKRLLVLWCSDQRWDDPNGYAAGGREALHAAISSDEGKTWKGFREVLISPRLLSDSVKGDRGTAYPSAVETKDGKVVFVSGQAKARAVVMFDPAWLEKNTASDNFSDGLVQWTLFGADSSQAALKPLPGKKREALLIRKPADQKNEDIEGVWNFPMVAKGKLMLEIRRNPGNKGIKLALSDNFSVSCDKKAFANAPVSFSLPGIRDTAASLLKVQLRWDSRNKKVYLFVNGKVEKKKYFKRNAPFGLNYLRVGIPGRVPDSAGYFIESVKIQPARP